MTREQFKDVLKQFRKNVGRGFGTSYHGLVIVDSIPDLVLEHDSISVARYANLIKLYFQTGEILTIYKNSCEIYNRFVGCEIPFMVNFSKSICTNLIAYNRSSNPKIPIYFSNEYN